MTFCSLESLNGAVFFRKRVKTLSGSPGHGKGVRIADGSWRRQVGAVLVSVGPLGARWCSSARAVPRNART